MSASQTQPLGECPLCQAANPYTMAACVACGARLPWADAIARQPAPGAPTQVLPASPAPTAAPHYAHPSSHFQNAGDQVRLATPGEMAERTKLMGAGCMYAAVIFLGVPIVIGLFIAFLVVLSGH